ncbi:alpha-L-rhamnosidase N-terminal domain-containing protein [Streptomyces sp. NPDC001348]
MKGTRTSAAAAVAAALALTLAGQAQAAPRTSRPAPLSAVDLKTENKVHPIGLDDRAPLLSWRSAGSPQTAYEIRAAHSVDALRKGRADVWRTGRVISASSAGIPFTGALTAREAVAWQVRVWDGAGRVSPWSSPAYDYTRPDGSVSPLPVFGKSFAVHGKVAKARLYMTGLGMYATSLNGKAVSANVLEPGQTTYSAEVDYHTYDLTRQLRDGVNTLGIETGSGAYQRVKTPGHYFFGGRLESYTVYGEPKAIAQLEITYADGRRETVATDPSWRTALGPTTY